jgi:hypothetical protein
MLQDCYAMRTFPNLLCIVLSCVLGVLLHNFRINSESERGTLSELLAAWRYIIVTRLYVNNFVQKWRSYLFCPGCARGREFDTLNLLGQERIRFSKMAVLFDDATHSQVDIDGRFRDSQP